MDKSRELKQLLRDIVDVTPNLPIPGMVTEVTGDRCTVRLADGMLLSDVKLKATMDHSTDYFMISPKVGSSVVLLSLTGDLENLTVIKVDQAQSISFFQDGLECMVDSTDKKITVKNDTTSLGAILSDLGALLKGLKVNTPNGPSTSLMPDSLQAIEQYENKVKALLK